MNLKDIQKLISQDILFLNTKIATELNSKIKLINKLSKYMLKNKGKYIRPIAIILATKALKCKTKKYFTLSTLIELIHMATLLHDDIVDNAKIRRGKKSAHFMFGRSSAILVGDFIYTRAFQMISSLNSLRIFKILANSVNMIATGEILQLTYANDPNITVKNYMQIIYQKTASLFEAALYSSAILSEANLMEEKALRNYGKYLGISFQLINDVSDYNVKNIRSEMCAGNDLNNGKLTLPLLHAMKNSNQKQFNFIQTAIRVGNQRHLLHNILKIMYEYNSLEFTLNCAKLKIEKAISCLNVLPSSSYRQGLKALAKVFLKEHVKNYK
ncbi:octaprenyl diphosphate synthase [Wigglesworthia glossinidia endosymbiont of Glossina morsitans morsitans (Yale colony)]|uniref:Octaprenyl diphosphate synthase n=1 Tax=Wigglesworthia glossinidia endosymbiont of Glossina morsitans morsitans (Yale colony) TaxID=1142511 RepID=H6Q4Q9_WIGGL|nr:polyprenyl synthetase family protein [Wigglesworthia glossinidia]AFA41119.1 octaprenyl diphosphate synthase [Wigglesworthia glossinidia endosymbiont of Glossina morsitans morsitans (Yale colony)]